MKFLICALAMLASPVAAHDAALELKLDFDAAATKFLKEQGEMVVVSVWFYGEPAPDNELPVFETGIIYLGGEELTLWPKDQTIHVGRNLAAAPVTSVIEPRVNVTVYSARLSSADNLLDCSLVEGPTAALSKAPQEIACKLLQ